MNRSFLYLFMGCAAWGVQAEDADYQLLSSMFVGVKGGYQWGIDDAYQSSAPRAMLYGLYGGVEFIPSWRWSIGYQHHDKLDAESTGIEVKTWLLETAIRYDWYLVDDWSMYGKAGFAYWNMAKESSAAGPINVNGFSPIGELGMSYIVNPHIQLSLGYQYIDRIGKSTTGHYDSHAALFSVDYFFGSPSHLRQVPVSAATNPNEVSSFEDAVSAQSDLSSLRPVQGLVTDMLNDGTPMVISEIIDGFRSGSASIGQYFNKVLGELASVLIENPELKLLIEGHTDSTGSKAFNQQLSERRASAVADQLYLRGVRREQLTVVGKGQLEPLTSNDTEKGRARNRRVELTLSSF
ncbi:OmpA family protein [Vibrio cholerae]|uniref:OmpA family protein n=1 Tax=Vibrio cholerae TaxID=666 RepID=UPI002DB444D4|nr:OmpA family protein [Vibrio cholerae]MEB5517867.1 OmpA family protein [Vibrio cholerae]